MVVPLAVLPYMMWSFPDQARAHLVETAERVALHRETVEPDWIVYMPRLYASDAAREWLPQLIRSGGYEIRDSDGEAALLARPGTGVEPERPSDAVAARGPTEPDERRAP
jgi:hypothetical protein